MLMALLLVLSLREIDERFAPIAKKATMRVRRTASRRVVPENCRAFLLPGRHRTAEGSALIAPLFVGLGTFVQRIRRRCGHLKRTRAFGIPRTSIAEFDSIQTGNSTSAAAIVR